MIFLVKGKVRIVEWVAAPVLGTALDSTVTGQKVETVLSSKFCTVFNGLQRGREATQETLGHLP